MPTIPASMAPEIYRHLRETGQNDQIPDFSPKPAKSKYRAVKAEVDGRVFHSKKEANRYLDLKAEQMAGSISDLQLQVSFPLAVNGATICRYVADFVYVRDGRTVIEDVKSAFTRKLPVYRIKAKFMAAIGKPITEV